MTCPSGLLGRPEPDARPRGYRPGPRGGRRATIANGYQALGFTDLAHATMPAAIEGLSRAARIWDELGNRRAHASATAPSGTAVPPDAATPKQLGSCFGTPAWAPRMPSTRVAIWALEGTADWLEPPAEQKTPTTCWSAADVCST